MFRIYRGLGPPYGVALLHVAPPYAHYTPPLTPLFPPHFLLWLVFAVPPCGTCPVGDCFLLVLGHPWRSLFYLHTFNLTV